MNSKNQKSYSAQFKFDCAMECLRQEDIDTVAEQKQVDRNRLDGWWKKVTEHGAEIFEDNPSEKTCAPPKTCIHPKRLKTVTDEISFLRMIIRWFFPESWERAQLARSMVYHRLSGVNQACRALDISKETYYKSKNPKYRFLEKYDYLKPYIMDIAEKHPSYGYPRIKKELEESYNITVNHKVLLKLLRSWGISKNQRDEYGDYGHRMN